MNSNRFAQTVVTMVVAALSSSALAVSLTVQQVRQRYPWNGLVDIDYTVQLADGETAPDKTNDRLEVTVTDNGVSPAVSYIAHVFEQAPLPLTAGAHRITWNAKADGVSFVSKNATVKLAIAHYGKKFMIVDLTGTTAEGKFPVTYTDIEPEGGFNVDLYKGDRMAFRLLPPGQYMMGSPTDDPGHQENEVQHYVGLTKPFYIGIFEVTQKQYEYIMGAGTNPSTYTGDYRPVTDLTYQDLRGATKGLLWPESAEVDDGSFVDVFRAKTGLDDFDLPLEAQWEYACRAGVETFLPTNVVPSGLSSQKAVQKLLGRISDNASDGKGGVECNGSHTKVGSYQANDWGLYDFIGNATEYCLDRYIADLSTLNDPLDPKGPARTESSYFVARGSYCGSAATFVHSAYRVFHTKILSNSKWNFSGVRLCRTLK